MEPATPSTIHTVAPDGDVILEVGPDLVHLRVASHCLRSASTVFNAMFGSDWSEGQDLSSESPKHIKMEEDDPEAMHAACLVLHHSNHAEPLVPMPWGVLQLAILADKYRLIVALKYAAVFWLRRCGDGANMTEKIYLLAAAFQFRAGDEFTRLARELVLNNRGSFLGLITHEIVLDILPLATLRLLEERRAWARLATMALLADGIEKEGRRYPDERVCAWVRERRDEFARIRARDRMSWLLQARLSAIMARINEIRPPPTVTPADPSAPEHPRAALTRIVKCTTICFDCVEDAACQHHAESAQCRTLDYR